MLPGKADSGDASTAAGRRDAILYPVPGCDQSMERQGIQVKVSDISDAMNLPRPGVTRTVKEMEKKGYLQKTASEEDGRVTYLTVTEAGKNLSREFDEEYFSGLAPYLSEISDEDADCMIRTIGKFYEIMSERREHYDK